MTKAYEDAIREIESLTARKIKAAAIGLSRGEYY
jgi:hypothetical protein